MFGYYLKTNTPYKTSTVQTSILRNYFTYRLVKGFYQTLNLD